MKKYGEAAILEMYFKALPEVVKNAATPLSQVDKITMYGDGNSSRLVGDIIGSTTKVTDGLSAATGVDLRDLLAGFLGGKKADKTSDETQEESDGTDEYIYNYEENRDSDNDAYNTDDSQYYTEYDPDDNNTPEV